MSLVPSPLPLSVIRLHKCATTSPIAVKPHAHSLGASDMSPTLPATYRHGIPQVITYVGSFVETWARKVRKGSRYMSNTDQVFLRDLLRGHYTKAQTALERAIDLSVNAETDEAAYAFGLTFNAIVAERRQQTRLHLPDATIEAWVRETISQCHADPLQQDAVLTLDPSRCAAAADATVQHAAEAMRLAGLFRLNAGRLAR